MFEVKTIFYRGGHHVMRNIFSQVEARRKFEGHRHFFKRNPLFFITYSCSLPRELSKTL